MGNTLKEIPPEYQALWVGAGNERETEYRWVWGNLIPQGRVLDVGCCESRLAEVLAKLGYDVWGIDIRFYANPRDWSFVRGDIRQTSFDSGFFEQIIAVSTIEHIGMNAYGNSWIDVEHGDRMAVLEMYRILMPYGTMLITLPYGSSKGDYWIRYYNKNSLNQLLYGLDWDATYYLKENGVWRRCEEHEASSMPSGDGALPQSIVCLKVKK